MLPAFYFSFLYLTQQGSKGTCIYYIHNIYIYIYIYIATFTSIKPASCPNKNISIDLCDTIKNLLEMGVDIWTVHWYYFTKFIFE